jgi:hypothetical protein
VAAYIAIVAIWLVVSFVAGAHRRPSDEVDSACLDSRVGYSPRTGSRPPRGGVGSKPYPPVRTPSL